MSKTNLGFEIININGEFIELICYFRNNKNVGINVAKYIWKDLKKRGCNIKICNNLRFTIKQIKSSFTRSFIIKVLPLLTEEMENKKKSLFNFIKSSKNDYSIKQMTDSTLLDKIAETLPKHKLEVDEILKEKFEII